MTWRMWGGAFRPRRSRGRDPGPGDEVRYHRDRLIDDYVARGMDRRDAERRVFLEFGNVGQIEEAVRDVRGRWLDDFVQDLRYTLRTLRRTPGFTAVAVLSLALGIGANAGIFSLINAVMLRRLPVPEPDRLVHITRQSPTGGPASVSYPLFEHFRDNITAIGGAFAHSTSTPTVIIDGQDEVVTAELVTGQYYSVLGVESAAGRLLTPADDALTQPSPAAVISDRYWARRFGRNPSAIGKTITLSGGDRVFTIVGVTPPFFLSARAGYVPDVTLPLLHVMPEQRRRAADFNFLSMLARLEPGATVEQANAEVQVQWRAFLQTLLTNVPEKDRPKFLQQRAKAFPAGDGFNAFRYDYGQSLLILMGSVCLVLLLACVNLSGLLLARGAARRREISIRLAIGAGKGRVIRQFLTESLTLAVLGGGIGLLLAAKMSGALLTMFVDGRPVDLSAAPDWRVAVFTAVISAIACIAAGLAPALQAIRVNVNPALKEVRARNQGRLGKALVVAQFAISMVLIVGATLFIGTLVKLHAVDRGFNSREILVVNVRQSRNYAGDRATAVQQAFLERLAAVPGVQSASAVQMLPVTGNEWSRSVQVEGYTFRPNESESVGFNVIAPHYFATLGIPLLSGRDFDQRDGPGGPNVAIVTESFGRYFFGDRPAIGRHVTSVGVTYEIVGVVRDAKAQDLRTPIVKTMFIPWTLREDEQPFKYSFLLRAGLGDPTRLASTVERLAPEVDPALRVRATSTYDTLIDRSIVTERIMAALGGVFGVLALLIAALGMFGVLAFQVARRTNELGLRMALGAHRWAIRGLVLRDVAWMVATGVVIGAVVARTLTGLAGALLFGLAPGDAGVFAVAGLVLAVAAVLAGWLPARRASRVDPLVALRHE
jgi:predicted permease